MARFLQRLTSFSRLILFDQRGTGLSDRVSNDELPTLEQRMDDVRAVLDAVGSERAALFGHSEGGNMCVLFAATYPERTVALITLGCFAKRRDPDDDYPWAPSAEDREESAASVERNWGHLRREDVGYYAPSRVGDEQFVHNLERYLRRAASPGAAAALLRMNSHIDVREVLPTIRVPTLVLHRTGDHDVNVAEGRYLAAKIPGAKLVELDGADHWISAGDTGAIADEIEEFLTGKRPPVELDRGLATVLFTDIVGSTEQAAELGDRQWRDLRRACARRAVRDLRQRGHRRTRAGDPGRHPHRRMRTRRPKGSRHRRPHRGANRLTRRPPRSPTLTHSQDLVAGSGLEFEDRGLHELKGVPGGWRLYAAL